MMEINPNSFLDTFKNSVDVIRCNTTMFIGDVGTLTEYVLALGDKINSMK